MPGDILSSDRVFLCILATHVTIPATLPTHMSPLNNPNSGHILLFLPFRVHRKHHIPLYSAEAANESACRRVSMPHGQRSLQLSREGLRQHSSSAAAYRKCVGAVIELLNKPLRAVRLIGARLRPIDHDDNNYRPGRGMRMREKVLCSNSALENRKKGALWWNRMCSSSGGACVRAVCARSFQRFRQSKMCFDKFHAGAFFPLRLCPVTHVWCESRFQSLGAFWVGAQKIELAQHIPSFGLLSATCCTLV